MLQTKQKMLQMQQKVKKEGVDPKRKNKNNKNDRNN